MEVHDCSAPALRAPTVDGLFYPAEPGPLAARVQALLAEAPAGQSYALITPHAALDYAGAVAAAAFRSAADRRPTTAVLLGPMHRDAPEAVVVPESTGFQTPLGSVPVDRQLLGELRGPPETRDWFRTDDIPHLEEHCLEVQLPFLQQLFPALRIVPLLVGKPSLRLVQLLGQRLWETFSGRLAQTLFVATTNLIGPRACGQRFIQHVLAADWRWITEQAVRRRACSCGSGAVAAILHLHGRRGGPVRLLRQGDSREAGGAARRAVRYAAIALAD